MFQRSGARCCTRSGQLALAGILALAVTLIALTAMRTPAPYVGYERGPLQAAQLVEVARLYMASDKDPARRLCLCKLLTRMSELNETLPLRMYPTWLKEAVQKIDPEGGVYSDYVIFAIQTPAGFEAVVLNVTARVVAVQGTYRKEHKGRVHIMVSLRFEYVNAVASPFFSGWLCPRLNAEEPADLQRISECEWQIGVPLEEATPRGSGYVYWLRDEHGIWIAVTFSLPGSG